MSKKVDAQEVVASQNGYPEKGFFKDAKEIQKFYKQLSTEQLEEWASIEGLTFNPSESEPIHRMRVAMAILYAYFPRPEAKKAQSQYKTYTLEQLAQMAIENEVSVEMAEDDKITRMRLIMALRKAGLLEEKVKKAVGK